MKKLLQKWKIAAQGPVRSLGFCSLDSHLDCTASKYHKRFKENDELWGKYRRLKNEVCQGGGEKAINRHRKINRKLLVRDRVKLLLDDQNSFLEIGSLAGLGMDYGKIPAAGTLGGIGRVSGQLCMILANDATVKGGTIFPISLKKFLRCQEIAQQLRLPCIHLVDSGGAFLPLQSEIFLYGGRIFYNHAMMGASKVPQIAVVCGNCTAGGAYTPTMCDDAVIVDGVGSLFLGGPPLVKAATGEQVTAQELGGAMVHCQFSGSTDYFAPNEAEALKLCRDTVSTLLEEPRDGLSLSKDTEPKFSMAELQGLAGDNTPNRDFVYQVFGRILDKSEFSEFRELYGSSLVTGYGRIGLKLIGIVAGVGTPMNAKSASKACQFVQMCEERNIPLVFFQRTLHDGWSQSSSDTHDVIKNTAQLISVVSTSTVPKIAVNVGDCYGSDYYAMCGKSFDPTFYLAWPNAHICHTKEEPASEDSTAFFAASRMWIDELILPTDTRKVLFQCLEALPKRSLSIARAQKGVIRM